VSNFDHPLSLPDFQRRFPDDEACGRYLFDLRWPDGWRCPAGCGGTEFHLYDGGRGFFCRKCRKRRSLTAGTIMHRSKQSLLTWFYGAFLVTTLTPGISAVQFQRQLRLSRNETAFQMLHKLRAAMVNPEREPLHGVVEVDETFIGGRNRKGVQQGRGTQDKALVVGAVEVRATQRGHHRAGRVRLRLIADASAASLGRFVQESVARGTVVRTDGWRGYALKNLGVRHQTITDKDAGDPGLALPVIHREFSNLKTWLSGTHQGRVQKNHLQAYLNEFTFRHNRRFWKFSAFRRLLEFGLATTAPTYREIYGAEGLGETVHPRETQAGRQTRANHNHNM
jgi:hypothetical protein